MNHPLSNNELTALWTTILKLLGGNTSPTWLAQNYRDDDAESLVNQYRRKHEGAVASEQPENRTSGSLNTGLRSLKTGPMSITGAGSWNGSASNWTRRWIASPCRRFRPGPQFLPVNLKSAPPLWQ